VNVDVERQARWADVRVCRVIRALRHFAVSGRHLMVRISDLPTSRPVLAV
jgi:hypothetical protein